MNFHPTLKSLIGIRSAAITRALAWVLFSVFVFQVSAAKLSAICLQETAPTSAAVPGSPQLDGICDEIYLAAPVLKTVVPVRMHLGLTDGQAPAVGSVRACWDEQYLFLFAEIHDDQLSVAAGAPWEQDSIEFLIDENNSKNVQYESNDAQYRVNAEGQRTCGEANDTENFQAVVKKSETGYNVEAQIRLTTIKGTAGIRIGFDIQVNNDPGTGTRKSVFKWSDPTDDSWRNTSRFGTLVFASSAEEAGNVAANERREMQDVGGAPISVKPTPPDPAAPVLSARERVPEWARDAVFYQLFPERFRNGDSGNNPTRDSLEFVDIIPTSWRITPWTSQWYARDKWEHELGDEFYEDGVFHRRYGGDLQGVIDKLDYLDDLGINVIYFNPVFYARSMHKYDGNSFHHVDPHFGPDPVGDLKLIATESADPATWKMTAADELFFALVKKAHDRNIRIIIDGVFNHTGRDFFAFADIFREQQNSKYIDWYDVESFEDPATNDREFKYKSWWGVDTLPEFANNEDGSDLHPEPKAYIFAATRKWMDPNGDGETSDGIDGWRLDVANEVPAQFWRDWNVMIRQLNPDSFTVAEIWDDAGDFLEDCGFSSTMNYHGFAFPVKGFLVDCRAMTASQFASELKERMQTHAPEVQYALQNLVDSHDTDRIASMIVNAWHKFPYLRPERFDYDVGERCSPRHFDKYDISRPDERERNIQRIIATFQMTFVGAPMIYYGTEAGMDGADDPDDRMPMVWDDLKYESRTLGPGGETGRNEPVEFDRELHAFYRNAIQLRNDNPVLRSGDLEFTSTDDENSIVCFTRSNDDDTLLVVINRGESQADVQFPAGISAATMIFHSHLNDTSDSFPSVELNRPGKTTIVEIAPLSATVWRLEK